MTDSMIMQRFEILAGTVSDMVWTHRRDGAWEYVNARWSEYTGVSAQDSLGFGWRRAIHPDDLLLIKEHWCTAMAVGQAFQIRCRIRSASGSYAAFMVHTVPLESGHWLTTASRQSAELTPVKPPSLPSGLSDPAACHAPERPLAHEGHLQFALESADMGVWELDLTRGTACRSLRHDQIFGYRTMLPEWTYDYFLQHVTDSDRQRVDAEYRRALSEQRDWLVDCRINRADGETRWIRMSGRASHDSSGCPIRMWGIIEDTTERKLAEKALRDREAHFRSLANTAPAMLWVTNVDHHRTFISRGWCQFTGQSSEYALGDGWTHAVHPADRDRVARQFLAAAGRKDSFQLEYRLRTASGDYRWVLDAGRARFLSNGDFLGYVGSVTDVHDMRTAREEQQRTSELLHAVIDTTQDCVYVKDLDGRMRLANPAVLRAIGKPASLVIGHSDLEWLDDPELGARIEANDMRVMECGHTEVVEEWMSTPEGPRLFVATKSPLRNEHGEVVGLVGISRDVTEQKRAEQQVMESESRMRRLFDNAPANIAIFEGAQHECVYTNQFHNRFFGHRNCLQAPAHQVYPELVKQGFIRRLDSVYNSGTALVTPHVKIISDSRRGTMSVFHETLQPWLHEDGSVAGVMLMAFDITGEVDLRRQVEESEARFRALADNIAQLAWMADERGRVFWYNRRWLDYTGTTFKDMQNSHWRNVHHPDHAARVIRKVGRCLRTGEVFEDTFPLRSGEGHFRWFYSQAIPIRDENGKVTRWFGTHTDVTEQREAAHALEEADRRKNEFLAMLAHELRNPLAPVRYAVEILRNASSPDEVRNRARDTIDRQVAHMARLIDDLLDVSRITRGNIELRKEHCDLATIVHKTVAEYRLSLEAAGIGLSCEVPDTPLWLNGDPTRLIQAIGNLLHNAGKFTERGGHVRVNLSSTEHNAAELTITDTGVGIEGKLLSQLFEPFSQAAQTLDRSKGGLGLGLSLVKGLVELHGGSVLADSAGPGRGATFRLTLPLLAPSTKVCERPVRPYARAVSSELNVLIIEDNRDTAESLGTLLRMEGHSVNLAFDGPSGLALAKRTRPDVVLCDLGLPGGMDGYQVVRAMRAEMKAIEPHLFALSGYGQESDRRQAIEAGFERHFVKPVDYAELSEALAIASEDKRVCQNEC